MTNDEFFNNKIKETEDDYDAHRGSPIMTKDYAISIIKTSREMALMSSKDLYDFIQHKLCSIEKIDREVNYPDYEEELC